MAYRPFSIGSGDMDGFNFVLGIVEKITEGYGVFEIRLIGFGAAPAKQGKLVI
jgi:hypothetical protein